MLIFNYCYSNVIQLLYSFVNSSQKEQYFTGLRYSHFAYTCVGDCLTSPTLLYLKLRLEFILPLIYIIYIYM